LDLAKAEESVLGAIFIIILILLRKQGIAKGLPPRKSWTLGGPLQRPQRRPGSQSDQPMIADFLIRPYTCAIIAIAVVLFLVIDELEPYRRVAFVLQCAILATGGVAIANQLMS